MVGVEELVDYYSQRIKDPNGASLELFQYKSEEEDICKDGVRYNIHARFIGNGCFHIHISNEAGFWQSGYFEESNSVEVIHDKLINSLKKK